MLTQLLPLSSRAGNALDDPNTLTVCPLDAHYKDNFAIMGVQHHKRVGTNVTEFGHRNPVTKALRARTEQGMTPDVGRRATKRPKSLHVPQHLPPFLSQPTL